MTRLINVDVNPSAQALDLAKSGAYEVITPSRLAARALEVHYQSLSALAIKHLEASQSAIASPLQAQSLFRQALQDTLSPKDLLGTARAWLPTVRQLLQSSPNLETVSGSLFPRTTDLIRVAQKFQRHLQQSGLIDRSELYWRTLEVPLTPQKVLIYGYFQPRPDELAWINAVAATGSILFLPRTESPLFKEVCTSIARLEQQDWTVHSQQLASVTPGEFLSQKMLTPDASTEEQPHSIGVHGYPTFEGEIRGTLAQVKTLLNVGIRAREITVIARDERVYGERLIEVAWEYGIPLRALYDTPLLSTRLGGWLNQLVEVMETGFPFEGTAKLLSHPLGSNPDWGFWATVRGQHPQGFEQWRTIAHEHLALDLSALRNINQVRRRDTWVEWWETLFSTFDLRRRCARWARESIAFNTLQSALVELSKPEAEKLSWQEFRQELQDVLESLSVPAQPGRGGVELHKPTSIVGARYAHVFVVGMAEGMLPAPIANDPVLDFFEKQQLQLQGISLPTAAELARRETLSFWALLQTVTENVTFSYPQLKERAEQFPSPYLTQLEVEITPPPMPIVASPEELRRIYLRHNQPQDDPVLIRACHSWQVEEYRESANPPDEYDGKISLPFDYKDWTFSVSQLRSLGQCPFQWFAARVLQLGEPEEAEENLTPLLRGNLYHKVLELVVQAVLDDPTLALADLDLLAAKFSEAEQALNFPNFPTWEQRRPEHIDHLASVLQTPDFWSEGAKPVALETRFQGEWHGLKIRGRVDRIDHTPDGLVLIDYKTGGSPPKGIKDDLGKASIDLQLPLYQEVAAESLFPGEPVANAYYYSLTKRKVMYPSRNAPQEQLPSAIERCKAHLDTGYYPVQPDQEQSACTYCDFDALCRQGNRVHRKENHHGTN